MELIPLTSSQEAIRASRSATRERNRVKAIRDLWPEMFRIIKECRPTWVVGENVSGHIKLGLDAVLSDLEGQGYGTRTFSISASSVGANHKRERIWILAHAGRALRQGSQFGEKNENETEKENANFAQRSGEASAADVADAFKRNVEAGRERRRAIREGHQGEGFPGDATGRGENPWEGWWTVEPEVGRMDHGIPKRVDRLKCLGNSLIPMIPYLIGKSIMETYHE